MSEQYRAQQGTVIPTLFIGAGGTGSRIVDRIAARAEQLPNWRDQLEPLTHFVSIDTNELDQHKLRFIPAQNRLNIAAFDKAKAIENLRRSNDPQALQWLDQGYRPRPGVKPGAGQIRVESRLGFFHHSPKIRQRLQQLIEQSLRPGVTWRQQSPPKFNVYLFCTLAGGTGSGCFLSLAYLIDEVIRDQEWHPRVIGNLLLSTLLTNKVGPELHPDIHANTYAALKELEHLTKLDYAQVKREGRGYEDFVYCRDSTRSEITRVATRPFFLTFVFDRPPHLGLPDAQAAIADAAFLQVFTPIIDNLAGELDNYEKNLEDLTRFPGDLRNVGSGYTKNFGAFGAAALVLPAAELLTYVSLRFAAEAVRTQITFGLDDDTEADERMRALARCAVCYDDPKFLSMSDAGRARTIQASFVRSIREMARLDERDGLEDGYWQRLASATDQGTVTGTNDQGEPIRSEPLIDRVARELGDARRALLDKIAIKDRTLSFHREGIQQYLEYVGRLREDLRQARNVVDENISLLVNGAEEGELITDLGLDPIHERYLVVRLLDTCENEWLPQTQTQLDKARQAGFDNPNVRERLENELYQSFQEVVAKRSLLRRDQAFHDVRDQAQEELRKVINASRRQLDAEIRQRQLRGLEQYLNRSASQYSRLATRMNDLVRDLEREAERLRRGEGTDVRPLALRVEVFETLEEPRERLWATVYKRLFLDQGRRLATFDRKRLTRTVSRQLAPRLDSEERAVEKSVEETVSDLRRALIELGRERLGPRLLGGDGAPGLDLAEGLRLEAQIQLGAAIKAGDRASEQAIDAYCTRKFRALSQLAGVLARVNEAEADTLDDGVKVNSTRQLIIGGRSTSSDRFSESLAATLATGGKQVKVDRWYDPRIAIVHDVELPIPLYYFESVTREIEEAYLKLAADETRPFLLHTDFNWEKSLPNLNPRRSEVTVGWSLEALIRSLLARVIQRRSTAWVWRPTGHDVDRTLGTNLANTLYQLGKIHRDEDLRRRFERDLDAAWADLDADQEQRRRAQLEGQLGTWLEDMSFREDDSVLSREDVLDRPVLRAMAQAVAGRHVATARAVGGATGRYDSFHID